MAQEDPTMVLFPWIGCIIQSVSSTEKKAFFYETMKKKIFSEVHVSI